MGRERRMYLVRHRVRGSWRTGAAREPATRLSGARSRVCRFALRMTAARGLPSPSPPPGRPPPPPSLLASPSRPVDAEHPAYGVIPGGWMSISK
jgi:hypothetical protein